MSVLVTVVLDPLNNSPIEQIYISCFIYIYIHLYVSFKGYISFKGVDSHSC